MSDTIHDIARKVGKACQYARKVLKDDPEALKILDEALMDFSKLLNNVVFLAGTLYSLNSRSAEEIIKALELTKAETDKRKAAAEDMTVH